VRLVKNHVVKMTATMNRSSQATMPSWEPSFSGHFLICSVSGGENQLTSQGLPAELERWGPSRNTRTGSFPRQVPTQRAQGSLLQAEISGGTAGLGVGEIRRRCRAHLTTLAVEQPLHLLFVQLVVLLPSTRAGPSTHEVRRPERARGHEGPVDELEKNCQRGDP